MNPTLRHFMRRRWLRELLVVALLFRALIPGGYMTDVGSDGLPTLTLCAYVMPLAVQGAPEGASGSDTGDGQSDHAMHGVCPQAQLLSPAVAAPSWMALVASPRAVTPARAAADFLQQYRSPTPRSRLPRGPPALA
jgi:hypothetical protein